MRLYIRQKGQNYKFYEGDKEEAILHGMWRDGWRKPLHSKIFNNDNQELVTTTLTKNPSFWSSQKKTYQIRFHLENIDIEVKAIKAYKGHWAFEFKGDQYDFYFHYGLKKSLFKNDNQVAKYDKGTVHFWDNDSGFIISNNDENKLLLLALFLTFDMGETSDADININFGNLTGGVKEYNKYWHPVR